MSEGRRSEDDQLVRQLVSDMIPVVKRRIGIALERSRENVEEELSTLADLLSLEDHLNR